MDLLKDPVLSSGVKMDIYNQITILMEKRMINHEHFSWTFSDKPMCYWML